MTEPLEPPIPLTHTVRVPPFPVDALPATIADMVRSLAEFTQTDPAMAGTSALSALSACTGGHATIEVRSGWREPLCLFTATIAAPGERKSAVQRAMVAPIRIAERRLVEAGKIERMQSAARFEVAVKSVETLRNAVAKAEPAEHDKAMAEFLAAIEMMESITVPAVPRLLADDITPDASQLNRTLPAEDSAVPATARARRTRSRDFSLKPPLAIW